MRGVLVFDSPHLVARTAEQSMQMARSFSFLSLVLAVLVWSEAARAHDPSAYGGLFRSRDSGATWFPANPGRIVSGAIALAVSPLDPNHLLLATDSGLLRSLNGGLDWSLEAPSLLIGAVFAVAFDADGRRALAATGSAIFRSEDGRTWRETAVPGDAVPARVLVAAASGRIYLAGWRRLYRSDDWAASWVDPGSPPADEPATSVLAVPGSSETVYAVAADRLWATSDAGRTWRATDAGLPQGHVEAIALDSREPRRMWAAASGQMFRSDDAGESWRPWGRAVGAPSVVVRGIAVATTGHAIVLTTDRGLYRSADGGEHWELLADNLPGHLEAWPLVRDPTESETLYAGFALVPYPELWRLAAEGRTALDRIGPTELAGGIAFLGLLGLAAAAALRWLRRYDRERRALVTGASAPARQQAEDARG